MIELTQPSPQRRRFLQAAGTGALAAWSSAALAASAAPVDAVDLSPLQAPTEKQERMPKPNDAPDARVGYAVVGLGRIAVGRVLPALQKAKRSRVVSLVSGDRAKAGKLARQYGVRDAAVLDYASFDRIAADPAIEVVFIALPNSQHAEFTIRAARAGKHVLCEKPMATSVRDCERMIEACDKVGVKLMIAYRSQFEPNSRRIVKWVREGRLGPLQELVSANSQNMGDPAQWRLKRALAGGGPLPDVGIYCINAARFLSGEEPFEVAGTVHQPKGDPRFTEVEASVQFVLRFPSGFVATCSSSYAAHKSQFLRLTGTLASVDMNPAYAYQGVRMELHRVEQDEDVVERPQIAEADQFERELDAMSRSIRENTRPHAPGEEGLADQRIVEAIYRAAATGRTVKLDPVAVRRGPAPEDDA